MRNIFRRFKTKKMRIVQNGHPALRRVSAPIAAIDDDVRDLADKMTYTLMHNEIEGVGLAAPQVGVNKRIIVIYTCGGSPKDKSKLSPGEIVLNPLMPVALINPELVSMSQETICSGEGCLSLPGVGGDVVRAARVILKATLLDGQMVQVECANLLAKCLQHEIDHLDGILFIDKIPAEQLEEAKPALKLMEKEEAKRAK
ncbi:MAG: peptide deformylase [Victivallales bacterium]|nr:peptide deformylase [Victivallales bacterium]